MIIPESETLQEVQCSVKTRLDAPGTQKHVILRGIGKQRIVDDDKNRKKAVKVLGNKPASRLEKLGYLDQDLFIFH